MKLFDFPDIPKATAAAANTAAVKGLLPCSILLSGGSRQLRRSCALELAECALCPNKTGRSDLPCGVCSVCRRVKAGIHPDTAIIVPEDGKKQLSVGTVRQRVIAELYTAPAESKNKVYIFADADNMPAVVQNTLLKSIEEPPDGVLFIFCCEQRASLLTTVLSRLTEYSLGGEAEDKKNNAEAQSASAAEAAALAAADGDEFAVMTALSAMHKNRQMISDAAKKIIVIVRDAMAYSSSSELLSGCEKAAAALSRSYSTASLLKIKEIMDIIINSAASNANENLLITRFSSLLAQVMKERIA